MLPLLFGVLPTYGICLLVAFFVSSEAAARLATSVRVERNQMLASATAVLVAGVAGARMVYLLEHRASFPEVLALGAGGLTFVGSLPAATLVVLLLAQRWRLSFAQLADPLSHAAALSQAIGRIGCWLAGCCYGLPSLLFGIHFAPNSVAGPSPARFPMQLVESVLSFALFILLHRNRQWLQIRFRTFSIYLIGAAIIRMGTEPWRGDRILLASSVSVAWVESLLVLLIGLLGLIRSYRVRAETPRP